MPTLAKKGGRPSTAKGSKLLNKLYSKFLMLIDR
jgi:hypothetical protein